MRYQSYCTDIPFERNTFNTLKISFMLHFQIIFLTLSRKMYLKGSKLVIDKESQSSNWDNQELNAESVVVTVVGSLELVVHQEQSEV